MNLSPEDGRLFYRLYSALMFHANQRLKVIEEPVSDPKAYEDLPPESRAKVRDAVYEHRELIDQFVQENPSGLAG